MIKFIIKKLFSASKSYELDARIWIQYSLLKKKQIKFKI